MGRAPTVVSTLHVAAVGVLVVSATLLSRGPFTTGDAVVDVVLAQALVVVVASVTVTLALHRDERHALRAGLQRARGQAEDRAHQLAASEERFRQAFDNAPVGIVVVEAARRARGKAVPDVITRVNAALCELVQVLPAERLLGVPLSDLVHHDDVPELAALLDVTAERADSAHAEIRFVRPDGTWRWGLLSPSLVHDADSPAAAGGPGIGEPFVVVVVEDVTTRRAAEQALNHQALHDALTALPNRVLFHDRLEHALEGTERTGLPVGVLVLDLDGFKLVNDSAGHAAGDEVLRQVADRLRRCVRPSDTVARLGGDEFAVLCPQAPTATALQTVADRISEEVRASPFVVDGVRHAVGVSIGASLGAGRHDLDRVMGEADAAMYSAKRGGADRVRVQPMGGGTAVAAPRSARLLPLLRTAVTDGELLLHGQPVVDIATGTPIAVETLIRWRHPIRGLLPPAEFLDVLESTDLMIAAGRFVLADSCRMAAAWAEAAGGNAPAVHVNVSGRHLESGHITRDVHRALDDHSLPAQRLVLELTETYVPMITNSLRADLEQLRERGVRIALDDVGTGYSGLALLTQLPVDLLKIDRRFVEGLGADPRCDAIVRAVAGLGASLGLLVVAEGVETPAQSNHLQRHGIDTAQGYLWSPPRPETELHRLLITATSPDRSAAD